MDFIVHGILQARIREWVSSQPRDRTPVSQIAVRFFTSRATRRAGNPDCHCPVTGAPLASLTLAHPRRVPLPGKTERVPRGTHSPEPAAFPLLLPVVLKDCCLLESPGRFLITLTNYNQSHGCGTPGTSVLHRSPGDPDFLVAQTVKRLPTVGFNP